MLLSRVAGNKLVRAAVSMAALQACTVDNKQGEVLRIYAAVVILNLHLEARHCKDVEECVKSKVCKHALT